MRRGTIGIFSCLCIALLLNVLVPPGGDTLRFPVYTPMQGDFSWPEEKIPFTQTNSHYQEKEALYMTFHFPADLVFFGDSITQKFEWSDAFPKWRVANRGIGSDTTAGMTARLDSIVALSPRAISLMAGINDLVSHTPEETIESYRILLTALHNQLPDTQVIVTSVLPTSESHVVASVNIISLNTMLKRLCQELDVYYLDVFHDFADDKGNLRPEFDLDGIHLTVQGYLLWLSYLSPELERVIN